MRGAVLHAPGDVRVEERDRPTIVELERAGDRLEDVLGHAADVALLQPGVPLGAHPREHGDLLAP